MFSSLPRPRRRARLRRLLRRLLKRPPVHLVERDQARPPQARPEQRPGAAPGHQHRDVLAGLRRRLFRLGGGGRVIVAAVVDSDVVVREDDPLRRVRLPRELPVVLLRDALDEAQVHASNLALVSLRRRGSKRVDDLREPPLLHVVVDVVRHLPRGRGALSLRVREHERLLVLDEFHQTHRVFVFFLGLRAEAGDDVRGDCAPRDLFVYVFYQIQVRLARVPARHPLQRRRATALRGHVQTLAHVRTILNHLQHLVREVFGVRRREPHAHLRVDARDAVEQRGELHRPLPTRLRLVPRRKTRGVPAERRELARGDVPADRV
mmetsp:Transcript_12007/g.43252  ORF Transcript_12007/g.43252 Transcript_12007/m.43252 type:complete len:321 (-) Transcript_12007:1760-2722(-)